MPQALKKRYSTCFETYIDPEQHNSLEIKQMRVFATTLILGVSVV